MMSAEDFETFGVPRVGIMCRLVVDVYECPLHTGKNFDLVLQLLAEVMGPPQGFSQMR